MLHRHLDADLGQALTEEALMEEVSLRSADFKEGIAALRERRPARFEGR
jgi:2-(1,2-epoxy-1,2-dihydrophenyl)acetyl-CoA isomerase